MIFQRFMTVLYLLDIVHCHSQLISVIFLCLMTETEPASKTLQGSMVSRLFRCSTILNKIVVGEF
jgi:hypothetical protein